MTATNQLLEPKGWRITYKDSKNKACLELLPDHDTTILIGQAKGGKGGYSAVWVDCDGNLQTLGLTPKAGGWEARVKHRDGKTYLITVRKPTMNGKGRPEIGGMVKPVTTGRATTPNPYGGGPDAQGTWGAEANPGGGTGTSTGKTAA